MYKFYPPNSRLTVLCPMFSHKIRLGFPSPADDHIESRLDLAAHIIKHPSATYFVKAEGNSMEQYRVFDSDILVVDRSLDALQEDVVIAVVDGCLTCKAIDLKSRQLLSGNPEYPPIPLGDDVSLIIEGVVTHTVRALRCTR